uniref:IlGF domain-containing protein n=1 Tax=Panagrellus redivivus TaxID=6233 RepID=A0A7E4UMT6_PANRE
MLLRSIHVPSMHAPWITIFVIFVGLLLCARAFPFSMSFHNYPILDILKQETTTPVPKFGTLKLCPPGGRSFFEAFQLACPMRRKRSPLASYSSSMIAGKEYRPATIDEIMKICCAKGCEFTDFFPHCGPFSAAWK